MTVIDPFAVMNAVGLVAFAAVGTLKAADADLDILGASTLGLLTALGGGATRDVLVGRVPALLTSLSDVGLVGLGVAFGLLVGRWRADDALGHPLLQTADAIGLAAFAASGALVGVSAGVSAFGVIVLATLTGVGGGLVSDVLLRRVPAVLKEDFYATCAVLGGIAFLTVGSAGVGAPWPTAACAGVALVARLGALRFGWRLPTV